MPFVKSAWANSLNLKVLVAYIEGVLLSIVAVALMVLGLQALRSPLLIDEDLAEHAEELAEKLRFDTEGRPVGFSKEEARRTWMYQSLQGDLAYRLLDESGQVVLASPAGPAFWAPSGAPGAHLQRGRFAFESGGLPIRAATEPVEHQGRRWYLQFAASTRLTELFRLEVALPFMGIGATFFSLLLLFLFGLCAFVMLRRMLRPLREVSASAAAISPRSLHARLQSHGVPTEIVPLVDSFNRVLERLERGYRVQQEFLATAAHELKTPLALIRAQIEFMVPGEGRDALLQDVAHMTRQVQQLLLLAEASEAQNYAFALTDVRALAQETMAYLRRMAEAAGVSLELAEEGGPAINWHADRGALFTLLKNLLENAIQHAPAGTVVRLELAASSLSVRDHGPGASTDQLSQLFLRFWRGPHRRDHGAGLGLAICQEIAQAHGWTLAAEAAQPGLRLRLSR